MAKSLLFIPDISGFTEFVQTTEIEHSRNVISELLEALINANTLNLKLAEVEGDALFFYLENQIPSKDELIQQMKVMNIAFYNHIKVLKTKCQCNACKSLHKLKLKIVAHSAELSFIKVHDRVKPFGKEVIEIHRLLKNSIQFKNYILITQQLANDIQITKSYKNNLVTLKKGKEFYDGQEMRYLYSSISNEFVNKNPILPKVNDLQKDDLGVQFLSWLKNMFIPLNSYSYK